MTDERMFPLIIHYHERQPGEPYSELPRSVPWSIVAPYEAQALHNHCGQSLEKLAQRGGLDPRELCGIMIGKSFRELLEMTPEFAVKHILQSLAEFEESDGT